MKNIFKILICSLLMVSFSCQESENTIDDVLDYETGAIIRTISLDNFVVNSSDETSSWLATLEIQDGSDDSSLWSHVDVFVKMRDFTPDNGDNSTEFAQLYTWDATDFPNSPVGQPRGDFAAPWGDIKDVLGFTGGEYTPGDLLTIQLYLNLKDGRVFGPDSAAGIITGGFFSSPYTYNALLTCSPAPGTYTVKMYDNYGDGWQTGNYALGLEVNVDGVVQEQVAMCSQWGTYAFPCTPTSDGYYAETTVEIPVGTEVLTWSWPGDQYGEIGLAVLGPDGQLAYASGTYGEGVGTIGDGMLADDAFGNVGVGLLPIAICAE